MRSRGGVSLIELVAVIGASAVLLSLATVAFARFMQIRQRAQDHLERTTQIARLAEQFRRDVWAADRATTAEEAVLELSQKSNGRRVKYQIEGAGVVRQQDGDGPPARDSFVIPGVSVLRLETDGSMASIRLAPEIGIEKDQPEHGRPFKISATLGRDLRYAAGGQP